MKRHLLLTLLAVVIGCAAGLPAGPRLTVLVSIPPQTEIVERVGGDAVTVETLIAPGRSPATYEPSPRQLVLVTTADVLIPVGVPFERQVMSRIATFAPDVAVCGSPVESRQPDAGIEPTPSGHHHEGGMDPHFWLDPIGAIQHAEVVCDCLCAAAPDRCPSFRDRLDAYRAELEMLDHDIARRLAPVKGRTMVVFHPAYGHFAKRYGLHQLAIERDGKEPSVRHLTEVISRARAMEVRAVFVQPQFASSTVFAVAEATGAEIVELDPLASDLSANIERIAGAVARALGDPVNEEPS